MSEIKFREVYDFTPIAEGNPNQCIQFAIDFCRHFPEVIYCRDDGKYYKYNNGLYKSITFIEMQNLILRAKDIPGIRKITRAKRSEVIHTIADINNYSRKLFDQSGIINFKNCYVNLDNINEDGYVGHQHDMTLINTIQLPYEFNPRAKCDLWEATIWDIFKGDHNKISLLQQFFGYCLMKDTHFERMLFIVGEAGTGKSTILDSLGYMLGKENISSLNLSQMASPNYAGSLIGKYANIVTEIPDNEKEFEGELKKIVTGDDITINNKYEKIHTAKPFCKIIFSGNDMPNIQDPTNGVFRRMIYIPLNKVMKYENQDRNRRSELKREASGIFNWAIKGLNLIKQRNGIFLDKSSEEEVRQLRISNNPILQFIEEKVYYTGDGEHYITKEDMCDEYYDFCKKYKLKSYFSVPKLIKRITSYLPEDIEYKQKRTAKFGSHDRRMCFVGVILKNENEVIDKNFLERAKDLEVVDHL